MIKQICILTKSYKNGGYCVAGIDVNTREWIRLVNSEDPKEDEIRKEQLYINNKEIKCLDIVECDFIKHIPNSCQNENWLLNKSYSFKYIKSITLEELLDIAKIDDENEFICNNGVSLNSTEIENINRSLFIFLVQNLKIDSHLYEYFGEIRTKHKCTFTYNDTHYSNISLTDPVYRDFSYDGITIPNVLIIASLPCIPIGEGIYYKFAAKIIPLETRDVEYINNYKPSPTFNNKQSPFKKFDIVIKTEQTPGIVVFENYEQLKYIITEGVSYYLNFEYSLDNYLLALKHRNELKYVKKILESSRKELVNNYNTPLDVVDRRLKELIDMVKAPFKKVDAFIKQNEKQSKLQDILSYVNAMVCLYGLEDYIEQIVNSPCFIESKWLGVSTSKRKWQLAVSKKLETIADDIKEIHNIESENFESTFVYYFQTLSLQKAIKFNESLKNKNITTKSTSTTIRKPIIDVNETIDNVQVLLNVANSINPFTGEIIKGIDEALRVKLIQIARILSNTGETKEKQ